MLGVVKFLGTKTGMAAIGGSLVTLLVAWGLHSGVVGIMKMRHANELRMQKETLIEQFEKQKKVTEEVSNEYQKQITNLNSRVATLRSVRPTQCIVPASTPTDGHNAGTSGSGHAGQNGVTTSALYEYAGDAERYRIQLTSCQTFIRNTWHALKQ